MYYRYRKNGGEVLGKSVEDVWLDSTYIGVFSTGLDLDLSPLLWCDGGTIRMATQEELDAFESKAAEDKLTEQVSDAKNVVDASSRYKAGVPRMLRGLVSLMLQEINALRTELSLSTYSAEQLKTALKNKIDEENGS
jgi:hypothetical protein